MTRLLLTLFAWLNCATLLVPAVAQCPSSSCGIFPSCPPADSPQTAPLATNIMDLDGYQGSTNGYTPYPLPNFGAFCNGGTIENNQFIAFIAPDVSMQLQITSSGCMNQQGIQAQIFYSPDCSEFVPVSNCLTPGFAGTAILSPSNLTPGETYLLMIDGWAGDLCDFTITVITEDPLPVPGPISGQNTVCMASNPPLQYSIPPLQGATAYNWTIIPPLGTILGTPTDTVTIQWNTPVSDTSVILCVTAVNAFGASAPSCITIQLSPPLEGQEEQNLCVGTGECVTCAGQQFCAPGTYAVTLQNAKGCDSIVTCIINPVLPAINNLGNITECAPYTLTVGDSTFSTSQVSSVLLPDANWQGCDSLVIFNLCILEAKADIAPPEPLGCGPDSTVTLDGSGSTQGSGPCDSITYAWTGPSGGLVGPTDSLIATATLPGQYCLTVLNTHDGVTCTDQMCVEVEECTTNATTSPLPEGIAVFPSPATDWLEVAFGESQIKPDRLELWDVHGQRIRVLDLPPGSTRARLQLDGVPPGWYLLRLSANDAPIGHTGIVVMR